MSRKTDIETKSEEIESKKEESKESRVVPFILTEENSRLLNFENNQLLKQILSKLEGN